MPHDELCLPKGGALGGVICRSYALGGALPPHELCLARSHVSAVLAPCHGLLFAVPVADTLADNCFAVRNRRMKCHPCVEHALELSVSEHVQQTWRPFAGR